MKAKCRTVVQRRALEIGREGLSDADLQKIDDRMRATMRRLAREESLSGGGISALRAIDLRHVVHG